MKKLICLILSIGILGSSSANAFEIITRKVLTKGDSICMVYFLCQDPVDRKVSVFRHYGIDGLDFKEEDLKIQIYELHEYPLNYKTAIKLFEYLGKHMYKDMPW